MKPIRSHTTSESENAVAWNESSTGYVAACPRLAGQAHNFRRLFITGAVPSGLPAHIAQVIAGHRDITVAMGYEAAFPTEAVDARMAFLARRR